MSNKSPTQVDSTNNNNNNESEDDDFDVFESALTLEDRYVL